VTAVTALLLFAGCATPAREPHEEKASASSAQPLAADSNDAGAIVDAAPASPSAAGSSDGGAIAPAHSAARPQRCGPDIACPKGQVCALSRGEYVCIPGCHKPDDCPKGQVCQQVACIRAPCPRQCSSPASKVRVPR
jgi:hypothetical protein